MPILSDIIYPLKYESAWIHYRKGSGVVSDTFAANSVPQKIAFNAEEDPYNLVTLNTSLSTFSLVPGTYKMTPWWGSFYTLTWGGAWEYSTTLDLDGTTYDIGKGGRYNGQYYDKTVIGRSVVFIAESTTTGFLEFTQNRGNPEFFTPVVNVGDNDYFSIQIEKLK